MFFCLFLPNSISILALTGFPVCLSTPVKAGKIISSSFLSVKSILFIQCQFTGKSNQLVIHLERPNISPQEQALGDSGEKQTASTTWSIFN